jgi:hypothetical protein
VLDSIHESLACAGRKARKYAPSGADQSRLASEFTN